MVNRLAVVRTWDDDGAIVVSDPLDDAAGSSPGLSCPFRVCGLANDRRVCLPGERVFQGGGQRG